MKRGGLRFFVLWGAALLSFSAAGCTANKRLNNCIAGAVVGAGVGAAIGAGTGGNNHEHSDNAMLGAGIGAAVGGALGCLLTREEAPAPPPPPPPPPPRAEEPPPPTPTPQRIVLRGINFDYDKANIKPEFVPVLDEAAQTLKDNPDINVVVEGHTDSIASDSYNQRLSERRAAAVKQYLVSGGVAASRLETVGKGEREPVAPNTTPEGKDNPEGRAMNRRAELKVQ